MLTWILLGLVAAVVLLLVVIAVRPADFRIERSTAIAAPPGAVMELIEDFHQWSRWSPWDKMDPTQVVTIGGAPRGTGATYNWVGKKNGEGRMEIIEHRPNELVGIQLDFLKPFPSHNRCDFMMHHAHGGTHVVWRMTGTNNFMAKGFDLFMDMDKMLGRDFEKGLAALKVEAEGATGGPAAAGTSASGTRAPA